MINILYALTFIAFAFVIFTLIMGARALGSKAEGARDRSNIWMRRRVTGQVLAIGLLMVTVYVRQNGGA